MEARADNEPQGTDAIKAGRRAVGASALRWFSVSMSYPLLALALAVFTLVSYSATYLLVLILPLPFLAILLRRRRPPLAAVPWWAGLALWAYVAVGRAAFALAAVSTPLSQTSWTLGIMGSLLPLITLAILWGERSGGPAFGFTLRRLWLQVVVGAGLAVVLQFVLRIPGVLHLDPSRIQWTALGRDLPYELMVIALGEETLFRSYIQVTLQRRYPWWAAALLASLLFGLWHMPGAFFDPIGMIFALGFPFAFGLLAAVLFRVTGSLGGPVVAHALYNALSGALP